MARLDEALRKQPFEVVKTACFQSAEMIRAFRASSLDLPWARLETGTQLLFKLLFISICHKINWDFLQRRLSERFLGEGEDRLLERALRMTPARMTELIGDYPRKERIRGAERAALMKDVASTLVGLFGGDAMVLYARSNRKIGGQAGFLEQIDAFRAYREDPLRKKSNVLVQELVREGIVEFLDVSDVAPAIDYHIMRLYLRSGRVLPTAAAVFEHLRVAERSETRLRLDKLLREATAEALRYTAFYAGLTVPVVNYIEWQIGRARCHDQRPNCLGECTLSEADADVIRLSPSACPYAGFCPALVDPQWGELREPILQKAYY